MKIGYLHLGITQNSESGLTRYSRLMAAEAKQRPELAVIEVELTLTDDTQKNSKLIKQAAIELSQADIVHIQYNRYIWTRGWRQLYYLWIFIRQCSSPLMVTLHDVYPDTYPTYGWLAALNSEYQIQTRYQVSLSKKAVRTIRSFLSAYLVNRLAVQWLSQCGQSIFVSTEEEVQRITHLVASKKLKKIPLFVEERSVNTTYKQARAALGLEGFKIVTLQGFIYVNKGHQLMVEAIPYLTEDIKVIFAGGSAPGNEPFLQNLFEQAQKKGVANRLIVTGYLSEADLERYLIASDLAVCPFTIFSASASLSTWISLVYPILASDLPQIAEYNQLEPGAIHTFNPYTAKALAEAILKLLPNGQDSENPSLVRLRDKLSISNIFNEYLKEYERV